MDIFKRKIMKKFLWMTLAAVMCLFTACSDDDDKVPEGPVATFAGKLPTKIGHYTFVYDENNRCVQVKDGSDTYYEIDYAKGIITSDDEDLNISFNGKGYITAISGKWNYEEEGDIYKGSGKISFHYNGKGELVSCSEKSSESGVENEERFSYESAYESTYTWDNGNLIKTVSKGTETEDGEKYEFGETYTIKYGDKKNEVGQNTMQQHNVLDLEDGGMFSLVGMFGKSSLYFPVSYTEKWYESDAEGKDEDERNYSVRYTLNEDGTINTEYINEYEVYSYLYSSVADEDVVKGRSLEDNSKAKKLNARSFFMRHRSRK